jgi:hypothetical protein
MHRSNLRHHSIKLVGSREQRRWHSQANSLAVFTLMTSSNLVCACKVGRVGPAQCQTDIAYCLLELRQPNKHALSAVFPSPRAS